MVVPRLLALLGVLSVAPLASTAAAPRSRDHPAMETEALWATPLWIWGSRGRGALAMNERLTRLILQRRAEDASERKSNRGGWQSAIDFFVRPDPSRSAEALRDWTFLHLFEYVLATNLSARAFTVDVLAAWANVNEDGDANAIHRHPDADLAGVYFVASETGPLAANDTLRSSSDRIEAVPSIHLPPGHFFALDPRPGLRHTPHTAPAGLRVVAPVEGTFLLFPAWLRHGVTPHRASPTSPSSPSSPSDPSEDKPRPRISVSFNARLRVADVPAHWSLERAMKWAADAAPTTALCLDGTCSIPDPTSARGHKTLRRLTDHLQRGGFNVSDEARQWGRVDAWSTPMGVGSWVWRAVDDVKASVDGARGGWDAGEEEVEEEDDDDEVSALLEDENEEATARGGVGASDAGVGDNQHDSPRTVSLEVDARARVHSTASPSESSLRAWPSGIRALRALRQVTRDLIRHHLQHHPTPQHDHHPNTRVRPSHGWAWLWDVGAFEADAAESETALLRSRVHHALTQTLSTFSHVAGPWTWTVHVSAVHALFAADTLLAVDGEAPGALSAPSTWRPDDLWVFVVVPSDALLALRAANASSPASNSSFASSSSDAPRCTLRLFDPRAIAEGSGGFGAHPATAVRAIPLRAGQVVVVPAWVEHVLDAEPDEADEGEVAGPSCAFLRVRASVRRVNL